MANVLVTGGGGYVGSALVPKLLAAGHRVRVLDLFLYGDDALDGCRGQPGYGEVKGDLRAPAALQRALEGCDAVIHLACISNDPSFELDPALGRSINYDAFRPLVRAAKQAGVERFIFASSSSVYGIKGEPEVTEDLPPEPLTAYSRYKAACERILAEEREGGFVTLVLRPATVCGYAPRQRLDLTVNLLTNHAVNRGRITVFGGGQTRPNIHIEDMTDLYVRCLEYPDHQIDGKTFDVGFENHTVLALAEKVRDVVGNGVDLVVRPTDDQRSYRVSSEKIHRELGFTPRRTIEDAVRDLCMAFQSGRLPRSMEDDRYYNVRRLKTLKLRGLPSIDGA